MLDKNITGILVRPLLTERGARIQDKDNQYLFRTSPEATKTSIKLAVEELFKVKVEKVRTMKVHGKFRRINKGGNFLPDWKKAIVTLKEGQKIDFFQTK
jgi:large subunit ribosomal protein L23